MSETREFVRLTVDGVETRDVAVDAEPPVDGFVLATPVVWSHLARCLANELHRRVTSPLPLAMVDMLLARRGTIGQFHAAVRP